MRRSACRSSQASAPAQPAFEQVKRLNLAMPPGGPFEDRGKEIGADGEELAARRACQRMRSGPKATLIIAAPRERGRERGLRAIALSETMTGEID